MNEKPSFSDQPSLRQKSEATRTAVMETLSSGSGQIDELHKKLTDALLTEDLEDLGSDPWATRVKALADFVRSDRPEGPHVSVGEMTPLKPDLTTLVILNTNRPFLLDSLVNELQSRAIPVHYVMHPILPVERDADGSFSGMGGTRPTESLICIDVDKPDSMTNAQLEERIRSVLHKVRVAVDDWPAMVDRVGNAISNLAPHDQEAADFLSWVRDGNFVLLGARDFDLDMQKPDILLPQEGTGLGIMRDPELQVLRMSNQFVDATPEITRFLTGPDAIIVTKANIVSEVHRRTHMDYIGIKRFSDSGEVVSELRLVGLFTSSAYTKSVRSIPILRQKVEAILEHFGHAPDSHSGKSVINTLEVFPRDELFQIQTDRLAEWVAAIEDLELRPRIRVFVRRDEYDRFVSVLSYIPRERFSTDTRVSIEQMLESRFDGSVVARYPYFASDTLVRVQFIVARFVGETPNVTSDVLEQEIADIIETWEDRIGKALSGTANEIHEAALNSADLAAAFEPGYQQHFAPERALVDYNNASGVLPSTPMAIDFFQADGAITAALYNLKGPVNLSKRVPILENLGFSVLDERTFTIARQDGAHIALHDMALTPSSPMDLAQNEVQLEEAFLSVWTGKAHNDGFNKLIGATPLGWREAALLRGYARMLRQMQTGFTSATVSGTLLRYPETAQSLSDLFAARFELGDVSIEARTERAEAISADIDTALNDVSGLEDDTIIRMMRACIMATVRTNFYHPDAATIAFKIDSKKLSFAPSPRPFREVFMFSTELEAVHLRGGPIARGGIRWSDRPTDFRTEVLGLVKAQQVKNAVIVPTGSKGGFVPQNMPIGGTREDIQAVGISAYKTFISTLISITDNIRDGVIVPPANTVRWDGDDPYLVVAADKGTATFSDIANEISQAHGFWLDDAFASGGSAGYDHKKMGITARGGWETVKRHFREMDHDIQHEPFTAVGVGDMSGDVFGNGMLLSKQTRLVAAFDHRDIFIDPNPDPTTSWEERKRLFDMGRSSWENYDQSKLSHGGGVFSRASKSIALTPEIKSALAVDADTMTPNELMTAILKAPVDLLWFGGIGTYVSAREETDLEVGDRANDAIRIKATDLKVKVVGEGANLGMTQRARIAYALKGGRVNTDAIDNSAGVNSSDLEVNIKIALGAAMQSDRITRDERNAILESMTDDVAEACLRNNRAQSLTISLAELSGTDVTGYQQGLIRELETAGGLEREVEFLPNDGEIAERIDNGVGLTRPEIAVLIGYAKNHLIEQIVASDLPDDPWFERDLMAYFPQRMQKEFADEIRHHQLRKEIIATTIANRTVNLGGPAIIVRLADETGAAPATICKAFEVSRILFGLDHLWEQIGHLRTSVSGRLQLDLFMDVENSLRNTTAWILENGDVERATEQLVDHYQPAATELDLASNGLTKSKHAFYEKAGISPDVITGLAKASNTITALDIYRIAERDGLALADAAAALERISTALELPAVLDAIGKVPTNTHAERLTLRQLEQMIRRSARRSARAIARSGFEPWLSDRKSTTFNQAKSSAIELVRSETPTIPRLFLLAQQIAKLTDDN